MKNKKSLPIIGVAVGLAIGLIFDIYIWNLLNSSIENVHEFPVRPSGGLPLGPGIATVITGSCGLAVGILLGKIRTPRI